MKNKNFKKYFNIGVTIFVSLALCILLYFLLEKLPAIFGTLKVLISVSMPLIYGAAFAYILFPVCVFFERIFGKLLVAVKNRNLANKINRSLSILCSFIFGLGVVFVVLYLIIPELYTSILNFVEASPEFVQKVSSFVDKFLSDNKELQTTINNLISDYATDFTKLLGDWSSQMLNVASSIGNGILSFAITIKNIFIGIIVAIYLLADRNHFKKSVKKLVDLIFNERMALTVKNEILFSHNVILNFISGRLLDSAIIGISCYILMLILNLPYALLISVIVGVTNIIPFFGPFIGAIPSAFLILLDDPIKCLIFVIMIIVLQQIDGNIIGPRIVGESIGLSSFWVLFSMLTFGGLFGLAGMIFGVPIFAIIYDIIKKIILKLESKKKLKSSDNSK